jgi:hypothetical protein
MYTIQRHAACSEFQHYCRYLEVSVEPTVTKENRYNSIQNKCLGWHCWFARLCVDSGRFGQIVNRCRGGMDTLGLHARSDGVQYSRSTAVLCMEWKRGRQAESPTWWATFWRFMPVCSTTGRARLSLASPSRAVHGRPDAERQGCVRFGN